DREPSPTLARCQCRTRVPHADGYPPPCVPRARGPGAAAPGPLPGRSPLLKSPAPVRRRQISPVRRRLRARRRTSRQPDDSENRSLEAGGQSRRPQEIGKDIPPPGGLRRDTTMRFDVLLDEIFSEVVVNDVAAIVVHEMSALFGAWQRHQRKPRQPVGG